MASNNVSQQAKLKGKIKKELIAKSNATFLWVSLACKKLLKVSSRKALSTLQDLPPGLPQLYGRMINQVFQTEDEEDQGICLEILRSVTLAFRPLSMEELIPIAELLPEIQAEDLSNLIELVLPLSPASSTVSMSVSPV